MVKRYFGYNYIQMTYEIDIGQALLWQAMIEYAVYLGIKNPSQSQYHFSFLILSELWKLSYLDKKI